MYIAIILNQAAIHEIRTQITLPNGKPFKCHLQLMMYEP